MMRPGLRARAIASWRRLARRLGAHEEALVEDIAGLGMIAFLTYLALLFTGGI